MNHSISSVSLLFISCLSACAHSSAVRNDALPVRRVVMYRNGVSYFERQGSVDDDELKFQVRASDVGDFLASLAVVDQQGSIRSISFHNEKSEKDTNDPKRIIEVVVHLSDGDHDLFASYITGAPIWKPTYRLVLDKQSALLQAWAIVQNQSGEDWKNIDLVLTTGAPIAFKTDLAEPTRVPRPWVTDTGEVIQSVPESETALHSEEELDEESADDNAYAESLEQAPAPMLGKLKKKSYRSRDHRPRPRPSTSGSSLRNRLGQGTQVMSRSTNHGPITEFILDQSVNVPSGTATMVNLLSQKVPGGRIHLFAPENGVPDSSRHPFMAARFANNTGVALERGSVAVYGNGSLLGQAVLQTTPKDAKTFLPFAIDRSVTVESQSSFDHAEAKLIKVYKGRVTIERFRERKTKFKIQNGSKETTRIFLRHPRWQNADLHQPPKGTEITDRTALIPLDINAHSKADVEIKERTPTTRTVDFNSSTAAEAIALYLKGPAIDQVQGPKLKAALQIFNAMQKTQTQLYHDRRQRSELQSQANETRGNLKAIKKIPSAKSLRERLVKSLNQLDKEIAQYTTRIVANENHHLELKVKLTDAVKDIHL